MQTEDNFSGAHPGRVGSPGDLPSPPPQTPPHRAVGRADPGLWGLLAPAPALAQVYRPEDAQELMFVMMT